MLDLEVDEAVAIAGRALDVLLRSGDGSVGRAGSDLRRIVGAAQASAESSLRNGALGDLLSESFQAAVDAGASAVSIARVRELLLEEQPTVPIATSVVTSLTLMSLAYESVIVAGTEFVSRNDLESALERLNAGFNAAEERVADNKDVAVYRQLIALHASVTRHLFEVARPLPRIVNYRFAAIMPALTLANRIYGDGARYRELLAENKTIHPLFARGEGRALSA